MIMGLFGSFFRTRQPTSTPQAHDLAQPQSVPQASGSNPYDDVYRSLDNPIARIFGGAANATYRAQARDAAEQWRERHRVADSFYDPSKDDPASFGYGQSAPTLPQLGQAPDGGSYPGPMDSIAAYAQGYGDQSTNNGGYDFAPVTAHADGSVSPIRGGTHIAIAPITGAQQQPPGMPSFGDLFPDMAQKRDAARMERLRAQIGRAEALGIDTTGLRQAYSDLIDPDYAPRYLTTPNAIIREQGGKAAPVLSWGTPEAYTDAFGNRRQSVYNPFPDAEYNPGPPPALPPAGAGGPPSLSGPPGASSGAKVAPAVSGKTHALQVAIAEDPANVHAVLATIMNRATATGGDLDAVLQQPHQFEVVSNGRANRVDPALVQKYMADPTIQAILNGDIPEQYQGFTNFYSPSAQAALKRPKPSWDDGSGVDLGKTRFFRKAGGSVPAVVAANQPNAARPPLMTDRRFTDVPMPGGLDMNQPGGGDLSTLSGDDLLKALPPQYANQVKMLAEGKLPVPTGAKASSPMWQRLFQWASQYDPSFDAVNYPSRVATQKSFSAGQDARNVTSINTTIAHLGKLSETIDNLGNGPFGPVNWMLNGPHEAMDPNYAAKQRAFKLAKTAVIDEMTRAFKGTGGSVHDVETFEKAIRDSDSPQALHAAIGTGLDLLDGRLQALADRYSTGMGRQVDPSFFLTPQAQATLSRIYGGGGVGEQASGPPTVPQVKGFKYLGVE